MRRCKSLYDYYRDYRAKIDKQKNVLMTWPGGPCIIIFGLKITDELVKLRGLGQDGLNKVFQLLLLCRYPYIGWLGLVIWSRVRIGYMLNWDHLENMLQQVNVLLFCFSIVWYGNHWSMVYVGNWRIRASLVCHRPQLDLVIRTVIEHIRQASWGLWPNHHLFAFLGTGLLAGLER